MGKIGKTRYYDPQGHFSVQVPLERLPSGILVRDEIQPERGAVWFFERAGCGDFFRINIFTSHLPIFSEEIEMSGLESSFSRIREFVKEEYQRDVPRSYLFHQESLNGKKFDMDFFVFDFPNGSTVRSPKTGKKLDGIRGVVSFFHNKSLFIVSYQKHFPPFEEFVTDKKQLQRLDRTNNGRVQWVTRDLLAVIDTMRFKFGNIKETVPRQKNDPLGPAMHSEPDWRELPYLSPD